MVMDSGVKVSGMLIEKFSKTQEEKGVERTFFAPKSYRVTEHEAKKGWLIRQPMGPYFFDTLKNTNNFCIL